MCLPPDKSSPEAQDILNLFKDESGGSDNKVKDCAGFASSVNREAYEYKCPTGYHGCLLRIHGKGNGSDFEKLFFEKRGESKLAAFSIKIISALSPTGVK